MGHDLKDAIAIVGMAGRFPGARDLGAIYATAWMRGAGSARASWRPSGSLPPS
jgi:hypothetical protein